MKDKDAKVQKLWMTRYIVRLIKKKKEAYARIRKLKSDKAPGEYIGSRKEFKQDFRRGKGNHEIFLASEIKENPKLFCKFIVSMQVARSTRGQKGECMHGATGGG